VLYYLIASLDYLPKAGVARGHIIVLVYSPYIVIVAIIKL
jgi:hypothetical protein